MQITSYWDNMPSLLNIQHLLLSHVHMQLTLGQQFIPHPQILVQVFQIVLVSTVTGMVHQCLVRYLRLMLFLQWITIIIVGSIIPLHSPHLAVELVVLINLQIHLSVKGQPGAVLICQDPDLLCIHLLLATGMPQHDWIEFFQFFYGI